MQIVATPFPALILDVSAIPGCATCVGRSMGPVVWLRTSNPYPAGTRAHELTHVRQWSMWAVPGWAAAALAWWLACPYWAAMLVVGFVAHGLAKKLSRRYALWIELSAAVAKLSAEGWPDVLLRAEARDLATAYGLDIGVDEAQRMLLDRR